MAYYELDPITFALRRLRSGSLAIDDRHRDRIGELPVTQPSTSDTVESTTQDFLAFLASISKGRTAKELGAKLQELVAAVEDTGKGGTLTARFTVKPAGKSGALTVTDEVIVKPPKLARPESIFFPDDNHNLLRSNPNQPELF